MALSETALYIIETQNAQDIKMIVLCLLLAYSILAFFLHDRIDKQKSYMHYWLGNLTKVFSYGYLMFSPLFFLLLMNYNIGLEIFVTIIIAFYLLVTGLFIGMSLYYGSSEIFRLYGFDDWNDFKEQRKERLSLKKYG